MYIGNIKQVSTKMKTLCEVGHMTEQKDIKKTVDVLHYGRHSPPPDATELNYQSLYRISLDDPGNT